MQSTPSHQTLIGKKVTLQTFSEINLTPRYLEWLRNPELMKFSNQRFFNHSMDSSITYFNSFVNSDNFFFAIYHENTFVGTMTAYRSLVHGTADIGILIGDGEQGKGLGKDAWATLMAALLTIGTRKVTGGTLRCNDAMIRIMKGCGMQSDGVRIAQELVDGVPQDIMYFTKFGEQ